MSPPRLLLVSLGLGRVPVFMDGTYEGKDVAFVPTAGMPYGDPAFVLRDRELLVEMGFNLRDVSLENENMDTLRAKLVDVDMVFVAGGNSFYLLQQVRASGFDTVLRELIEQGVPYIGASAGAVMVGPDLRPVATLDDPNAAPGLENMTGLGLVDFVTLPHYGVEKYLPEYRTILERFRGELNIIRLRNDEAIEVIGGKYQIVDSQ
jgi:dipeptidase E